MAGLDRGFEEWIDDTNTSHFGCGVLGVYGLVT